MQWKFERVLSVFETMALEHVAGIPLNYYENAPDWQSTCYQAFLRFQIWQTEKFSNSICLGLMEIWDKSADVFFYSSVWDPWKRWLSKGFAKHELSGTQVTTFPGPNNPRNIEAMKLIFFLFCFLKCAKVFVDSEIPIKIWENVFSFWHNGISTCWGNFYQLWPQYMSWKVNLLPSSPKISDLTNTNVFQLNLSTINGNLE